MTSHFYLHIPFCRQKCGYCKFALTPVFSDVKVEKYLEHLKSEIREYFSNPPNPLSQGGVIKTIYFGGWTPSILTIPQVRDVIELFRTYRTFDPDTEITLEANPEDITPEYVRWLRSIGIDRLSLWVQTLDPDALQTIGRSDPDTIYRALDTIFANGFEHVNTDWILGLPHVAPGQTLGYIREILDRHPLTHLSLYMLEQDLYPSGWKKLSLDVESLRTEQSDICKYLLSRGFIHYELSNFARPGYESRHNRAYWDHSDYRGFGLSAASYEGGRRYTNSASFAGYYRGELAEDEILSDESMRIERIMFGIRTDGIRLRNITPTEKLDELISDGLLVVRDQKILPTSAWIFLIDHIMGELI